MEDFLVLTFLIAAEVVNISLNAIELFSMWGNSNLPHFPKWGLEKLGWE